MKKTFLLCTLLATLAAPTGSAWADSDEYRHGYWEHGAKHARDRGQGWHYGWRDDGDSSGEDSTESPDTVTVDEAADGHIGSED